MCLVSILWHGAAWTFVLWGSLNAAYLAIEGFFGIPRAAPVTPRSAGQWARRLAATVLTFHLITVTFTAFPSPTLSDFWYSLCGIAQLDNLRASGLLPVIIGAAVFLVDVPQNAANDDTVCLRLRGGRSRRSTPAASSPCCCVASARVHASTSSTEAA